SRVTRTASHLAPLLVTNGNRSPFSSGASSAPSRPLPHFVRRRSGRGRLRSGMPKPPETARRRHAESGEDDQSDSVQHAERRPDPRPAARETEEKDREKEEESPHRDEDRPAFGGLGVEGRIQKPELARRPVHKPRDERGREDRRRQQPH